MKFVFVCCRAVESFSMTCFWEIPGRDLLVRLQVGVLQAICLFVNDTKNFNKNHII